MREIELLKTETEQIQTVELAGLETAIRVYWVETPADAVVSFGFDGQLFMDISNDLFTINHTALTIGNELMLPYGYSNFGGFIVITDLTELNIDGIGEWNLYYVEIDELEEMRKLYGSVV